MPSADKMAVRYPMGYKWTMDFIDNALIANLAALFALIPAALAAFRAQPARDAAFWWLSAVAFAGPLAWSITHISGMWPTGLSAALWIMIAACMALYLVLSRWMESVWRLAPLLLPYLCLVGVVATIWEEAPGRPLQMAALPAWIEAHIALSVLTYALLTLAAVAGTAALLRERALKTKHPTRLTAQLPAIADAERMQVRLLIVTEIMLGLGLVSGIAVQIYETGGMLAFNHKILLSVGAFVVIGALLIAHFRTGVRGRRISRMVLLAYLLVTLGYPGVKFVTDVLLA
ncbi:MAG: hypothetical protein CFH40_00839 [Alphaproteobacteria bacterium MarineAlpha10_Bin3]|jgi:ABC-type uncharacterized transport system permease subunit|nr:MAG: hypothetical protein CFH40_00839 [Alphaproteobacteria bacterium MarineAlpha10_Bin3]PPR73055.1 MAG: hypothetical protein CFH09_00839 [Alphaproteobacteria bacterium MarineAlpha4_Bin1]